MKKIIQPIRPEELVGLSSLFFGGATFLAATLAAWNLAASLRITEAFAVADGLLSNWIVWVAMAIGFHFVGRHIERELVVRMERIRMERKPAILVLPRRPGTDQPAAAA